ncbi:hypothetical protein NMY22_g11475 [Coprinellus aureogranulatus]|nr:hypothetical protein NMY22_g11475 [Coprinellus aureogranulatus]
MPRSKPIPPEVIRLAGNGDLDAIRRLGRLLDATNATPEIVEAIFKCLATFPVPVISTPTHKYILKNMVGARPSACLIALWKIVWRRKELTQPVRLAAVKYLRESGDSVFGWSRVCVQNGLSCVPEDMNMAGPAARRHAYFFQAKMLRHMLRLDGDVDSDFALHILSSPALIDLVLELWLAEDRRDTTPTGTLVCRILDTSMHTGCDIIFLVHVAITFDHSRDVFLARLKDRKQRTEFCLALADRAKHRWDVKAGDNVVGWVQSVCDLVGVSWDLCHDNPLLGRTFTRARVLGPLSYQVAQIAKQLAANDKLHSLVGRVVSTLLSLVYLALGDKLFQNLRRNWKDLGRGYFLEALFYTASSLRSGEGQNAKSISSLIEHVARHMAFPRLFGECTIADLLPEKLSRVPTLIQPWELLLQAHDTAKKAMTSLKGRPSVYFCDYLACALTGKELEALPYECAGCHSMVYCSSECQRRDWDKHHRRECQEARLLYQGQFEFISGSWCYHQIRGDHAAMIATIYADLPGVERYDQSMNFPLFSCTSMGSNQGGPYAGDHSEVVSCLDFSKQRYLNHRYATLIEAYSSKAVPFGWRLAQCMFPPLGDEDGIQVTALLKPVSGGFRAVYCTARDHHLPPFVREMGLDGNWDELMDY